MAAIFWSIWITRNKITFEGYVLKNPVTIIYIVCSFLNYWARLYDEVDAGKIKEGAKLLMDKVIPSSIQMMLPQHPRMVPMF
jgi:uncharacterized membrane protein